MTAQQYHQMAAAVKKTKYGKTAIGVVSKAIAFFTIVSYPVLLLYLILTPMQVYPSVVVPAVSFVVVSVFRNIYNAKRPYEEMDIEPLIPKDTKGKSFPSRHVFSIFMIAMTYTRIYMPMAVILFVLGTILGILRVIGGVHYTKDVVAGAVTGIVLGLVGYYVIAW